MLCLLFVGRKKKRGKKEKKKRKGKQPGAFIPRPEGRHTLLAVLDRIFVAVRYN
jgi:hypothetical protein